MGLRINTNVQSLAAQRQLGLNTEMQKRSLEKLSAGTRITRSADDAAGLSIAENMRGSIRSIRQGIRNASDGVGMIQTTEGAMNEIGNILIRFRELSMQAASDTIGDTERGFIDKEVQQLKTEIDRIANSTEYNGHKLLSGEGKILEIQVGHHNNPSQDRLILDATKTNLTTDVLGVSSINVLTKEAAQQNLDQVDVAIRSVMEQRSDMGAMQNRLESSINNSQIYSENLSAARSRIYDVDMASETAELTKNNILSQAGVSVLSQANQNALLALKLV